MEEGVISAVEIDGQWFILVRFVNGNEFITNESFDTREEAIAFWHSCEPALGATTVSIH